MTSVGEGSDGQEYDALAALSSVSTTLSASFPLALRVLVLVSLAAACWAANLHGLHLLGIDTAVVLDVRAGHTNEHVHPSKLYPPVYQLAACLAAWTALCWAVGFQVVAGGHGEAATGKAIAALSLVIAMLLVFLPADRLKRTERSMLTRSLKRIAFDSVFRPVPFCDVILADVLTSFAKVFGDLWVCVCSILFITRNEDNPVLLHYRELGVPILTALPYLFRFRQCIAEYLTAPTISPALPAMHSAGASSLQIPGNGHAQTHLQPHQPHQSLHRGHQPSIFVAPTSASSTPASPRTRALYNALKYATAFPVIFFSALQSNHGDPYNHPEDAIVADSATGPTAYFSSMTLFRIWVISVLVNSLYSFWWDVTNDWGLHLLLPRFSSKFPFVGMSRSGTHLRRTMLLPDSTIYYLVVALDLVLRFTWSLKLSSHLHEIHEIELGIFMLEALEVIRRWIWVYVRVEWEAVRKGGDTLEERLRLRHNDSDISLPLVKTSPTISPPLSSPPLQGNQAATGGAQLDRRVSAGHRKPTGVPYEYSATDDEMGLGRSGVLVEMPKR